MGKRFSELRRGGGIIAGALEGNESSRHALAVEGAAARLLPCEGAAAGAGGGNAEGRMKNAEGAAVEAVPMARRPAPLREEAAARDAQQGDRDGRAPRSQARLTAFFSSFSAKLRTVG